MYRQRQANAVGAQVNTDCRGWSQTDWGQQNPGPGPFGPRGILTAGVEVLPRNFLGGLSRSPAAGSTTQRSSTSLGDRAAGLEGGKRLTRLGAGNSKLDERL